MRCISLSLLVVLMSGANALGDDAADLKALQGTWRLTDVKGIEQRDLKNVDLKNVTITIADNKFVMKGLAKTPREFTFTIDSSKNPRAIDLVAQAGTFKGKANPAIYELDGDMLKLCVSNKAAKDRPTEFKPSERTGLFVFTLKRAKK